jgi:hypothetical protein
MGSVILNKDIIAHILSFLDPINLSHAATTNKRFAEIIKEYRIWRTVYVNWFLDEYEYRLITTFPPWSKMYEEFKDDHMCAFIINLSLFRAFTFYGSGLSVLFTPTLSAVKTRLILDSHWKSLCNHEHVEIFKKYFNNNESAGIGFKLDWCNTYNLIHNLIKLGYILKYSQK